MRPTAAAITSQDQQYKSSNTNKSKSKFNLWGIRDEGAIVWGGIYFILAQTDRSFAATAAAFIVVVVLWKLKIALLLQVPSSFLSNLPLLLVAYLNIIMVA